MSQQIGDDPDDSMQLNNNAEQEHFPETDISTEHNQAAAMSQPTELTTEALEAYQSQSQF